MAGRPVTARRTRSKPGAWCYAEAPVGLPQDSRGPARRAGQPSGSPHAASSSRPRAKDASSFGNSNLLVLEKAIELLPLVERTLCPARSAAASVPQVRFRDLTHHGVTCSLRNAMRSATRKPVMRVSRSATNRASIRATIFAASESCSLTSTGSHKPRPTHAFIRLVPSVCSKNLRAR